MTGVSYGAITVVNAMPCGKGATIGICLKTVAEFFAKGDGRRVDILNDPGEDTTMARLCVSKAFEYIGAEEPEDWHLKIKSEIPISKGLKSSSSACNAIISSVLERYGSEAEPLDVVKLGIDCARKAKVTVTGSMDDSCGCHLGGFVITDNASDRLLHNSNIGEFDIVLHIPDRKIRKTGLPLDALRSMAPRFEDLIERSKTDPFGIMTENGRLISKASGLDNSVAEMALKNGALAAGVSGSGPATAIVLEKNTTEEFIETTGIKDCILTKTRGMS